MLVLSWQDFVLCVPRCPHRHTCPLKIQPGVFLFYQSLCLCMCSYKLPDSVLRAPLTKFGNHWLKLVLTSIDSKLPCVLPFKREQRRLTIRVQNRNCFILGVLFSGCAQKRKLTFKRFSRWSCSVLGNIENVQIILYNYMSITGVIVTNGALHEGARLLGTPLNIIENQCSTTPLWHQL